MPSRKACLLLLALAGTVLVASAVALAAAPGLSFTVSPGYAKRMLLRCHAEAPGDPYTFFRRGASITFAGVLRPKPAGSWSVAVRIKRCDGRKWQTVSVRRAVGRSDGSFRVVYAARAAGAFKVYAEYGVPPKVQSVKRFLIVR